MKRLLEIRARKAEIRKMLEGEGEVNLQELETELRSLDEEEKSIEQRKAIAAGITAETTEARKVEKPDDKDPETEAKEERAKRGKDLMEKRSVTVASSNIVMAKHTATDIKPTFNEVSSLIDRVTIKTLIGGESYEQPYLERATILLKDQLTIPPSRHLTKQAS